MQSDSASPKSINRLPVHEWLAVVSILILLFGITFIVWWSGDTGISMQRGTPYYIVDQDIEVVVDGAVEKPGSYIVKRGARISDVLALAGELPDSDLRRLRVERKVRNGQIIKVPHRPMITVYLEGAVKAPHSITIPKGSSLSDIIPLIEFEEGAHVDKLRRKRRLKDGEIIKVGV